MTFLCAGKREERETKEWENKGAGEIHLNLREEKGWPRVYILPVQQHKRDESSSVGGWTDFHFGVHFMVDPHEASEESCALNNDAEQATGP